MRSHNDMMRSVYPKLMLEGGQQPGTFGGVATNGHAPGMQGGGAPYGMDPRYSTMNGQLVMDPRYASLAAAGVGGGTSGPMMPPTSTSGMPRPPLARAVHLTLGVAVLGR